MGPLGWQETVFLFLLALLIFGPRKLPELGKTIGKALTEFRRASSELKSTWDREISSLERESESLKDVTQTYANEIQSSYSGSDNYSYDESSYYDSYTSESGDSTAAQPSSVSASAPEGADPAAEEIGAAPEAMVADAGDAAPEPKPVGMAEEGPESESQAVAG